MAVCYGLVDLQGRDWRLVAIDWVVEDMKCLMGRQTFV